ncbi:hypothetical protein BDZ94DRAFT_1257009 [Collybia nuda]|uniref:Uncharacterized protein n=1 Tax=Collybia nuda TaxID=64659 RepID=A0A9P5Y6A1_9AGAR|nr:hypothetical protein BDZ94DRAFT_1257009 [Collybia nuda]
MSGRDFSLAKRWRGSKYVREFNGVGRRTRRRGAPGLGRSQRFICRTSQQRRNFP